MTVGEALKLQEVYKRIPKSIKRRWEAQCGKPSFMNVRSITKR